VRESVCVCVRGFVCVFEREREREREIILQLFSATRVANGAGLPSILNMMFMGVYV